MINKLLKEMVFSLIFTLIGFFIGFSLFKFEDSYKDDILLAFISALFLSIARTIHSYIKMRNNKPPNKREYPQN